ncbi:4'-phosphopantetheinyl transferase [Streptomyces sp. NPDC018947]|uniref:4'-phosphopantetheinyl transferase n=1 Tax=Streptomyces sp. NPDC018947 TaxID=3365054 RepID=UPI0037A70A90
MIEELVPAEVAARDLFGDARTHRLFDSERALVAGAVAERVREFTTVRWAAAQCVRRLGHAPAPLLPGRLGAPRWPRGLVGSLTHCAGYRAAVVARASVVSGLGIDAEPDEPLPDRVTGRVASAGELRHLAALHSAHPDVRWDRLLFCAKEAFYKLWSPVTGRWLGFDGAEVTFAPSPGDARGRGFVVRPAGAASGFPAVRGRWLARHGVLVAAIAVAAGELPAVRPAADGQEGTAVTGISS